jgi:ATP-binding cassette subfamily B multidrug efflux pump
VTDRTIHEDEREQERAYDARLTRRLLQYLAPYRLRVAAAVLLLMCGAAVEMVGPYLTKVAIDEAVPQGNADLLMVLVGVFLGTLALGFVFEYLQVVLTTWIGQRVMFDLRMQLFSHLQRLSPRYFDTNPVGRLMTRVTNDVETLNELFSSGAVTIFGDVFTVFFVLGAMMLLDWRLALVTMAVLPFVFVAAFFFRGLIRKASWEIRIRLARINAFLQERITGMRVVQLFGREDAALGRFEAVNREHLDANLHAIIWYALFFPIVEVLTAVALALILWYGGVSTFEGTMTVGVVAAFIQYARRFFRPIQDLSEKYNLLQGAVASSERIFALLDTPPQIVDVANPMPLPRPGRGEIEFRNVWFHYGDPLDDSVADDDWVLRDVSFRVPAGQRFAVVGATGSGKTTIINLLMRFYEPQRGEILFDGVPIALASTAELRQRIGLVLQDVFLFSEDVRSNIAFDRGEIPDERIIEAARRVGAHELITRLPEGYGQPLGERGASISVGERQLISFARALVFDPLVLVLDEATSSVDSQLEERIESALQELMLGRTTLVVAHRLSTIRDADQILVLHRGRIRERGTHAELLRLGGLYNRLHDLQFAVAESSAGGTLEQAP